MFYRKIFKLPIYPMIICVIVSDEVETINKFLEEQGIKDEYKIESQEDLYACTISGGLEVEGKAYNCKYVILNPYNEYSKLTHGTVAHEVTHLRSYLFKSTGMEPDINNDENECYIIGYLVDNITEFYEECATKGNLPPLGTCKYTLNLEKYENN